MSAVDNQAVAASYKSHKDAEDAVLELQKNGFPMDKISIIGRDWQAHKDVHGFYLPGMAIKAGVEQGAWFGGLFGMILGFGMFVFPIAGVVVVLGPLSGLIAGAIGGAGLGALVNGLVALGIPKKHAEGYEKRLQEGEFLVIINGPPEEAVRAHDLLISTSHTSLASH